jgi:uncharacterized protein
MTIIPARRLCFAALFLLLSANSRMVLAADTNAGAGHDQHRQDVATQLVQSMGLASVAHSAVLAVVADARLRLSKENPDKAALLEEAARHAVDMFASREQELERQLVSVYVQSPLTSEDMEKVSAFYRSDVGKTFLAAQPFVLKRSAEVTAGWATALRADADAQLRNVIQADAKK